MNISNLKAKMLLCFLLAFSNLSLLFSQEVICGCDDCPIILTDTIMLEAELNVSGLVNDDLSSTNQGLCSVTINFAHTFIPDLIMSLESPFGQVIGLTSAAYLSGNFNSDDSIYDMEFISCSEDPVNTTNIEKWDIFALGQQNLIFSGTILPFGQNDSIPESVNCLEDLNIGTANGKWTLRIRDRIRRDTGVLFTYSLEFCDMDGLAHCGSFPVSVNESFDKSINIYPNPTQDELKIEGLEVTNSTSFILQNLYGSQVMKGEMKHDRIDLTTIGSGAYLISIYADGKLLYSQKVIKL